MGALSIFFLFLPLNSFTLFLLKVVVSILMLLSSFGFHDFKSFVKNFLFLYFTSILLGGFMYFLNLNYSYTNKGLIFFHNGFSINFVVLCLLSPFILFCYVKDYRKRVRYQHYHQVSFRYRKKEYTYQGYLDTGNHLHDPYSRRPIHLLYDPHLSFREEDCLFVPFTSLGHHGLIKCLRLKTIMIDGKVHQNILLGLAEKPFHIEGANLILNHDYLEGLQ